MISWMLPPVCPVTKLRGGGPSGLMGSSCELLGCVDAPSASLHSCKVSSRTKRSVSTRGTPALATWASEKARCGAGGARTLPCERAVCRCSRCACCPGTRSTASSLTPPSRSARTPLLRQRVRRAATHIRRCGCIGGAETYTRYARSLVGTRWIAARAIVLCGKGSSCQRRC